MLPRLLRMHHSKDFRRTTKRGIRVSRPTLVVHAEHVLDDVVSGGMEYEARDSESGSL